MAMGRSANISDEVIEGRRSVRAEEERVERESWMVTREQLTKIGGMRRLKCVIGE